MPAAAGAYDLVQRIVSVSHVTAADYLNRSSQKLLYLPAAIHPSAGAHSELIIRPGTLGNAGAVGVAEMIDSDDAQPIANKVCTCIPACMHIVAPPLGLPGLGWLCSNERLSDELLVWAVAENQVKLQPTESPLPQLLYQ